MKEFIVGNELIGILQKQGFIETTSEHDKIKKVKKSFKLSKQSQKEIAFNGQKIVVNLNLKKDKEESIFKLTETELKILLLRFKLNSKDSKEFDSLEIFNFDGTSEKILVLKTLLENLMKNDSRISMQNKIKRIMDTYENIILN